MNPDLPLRFLAAVIITLVGVGLFLVGSRIILARASGKVQKFDGYRSGQAAIVYFTTPTCAPCKTLQRPAIESIKQKLGGRLQVIEVDASRQPDLAQDWGVMSVPTTFVIDTGGNPRHVNHGIATAEQLTSQLEDFVI